MLRLPGIIVLISGMTAWAEPIDWLRAEGGVPFERAVAFSGCAPSGSLTDKQAYKVALLRAQANIARTKHVTVSGEEHMTDQQGSASYNLTVFETTGDFLNPIMVVNQEITDIDNVQQLCLLVIERSQ